MTECCENCKRKMDLIKFDYSGKGCEHTAMDGFACMVFVSENEIVWMVGSNPKIDKCECFQAKGEQT